jgi:hypothetical protein
MTGFFLLGVGAMHLHMHMHMHSLHSYSASRRSSHQYNKANARDVAIYVENHKQYLLELLREHKKVT